MTREPRTQKYFGLRSSTDLYLKLIHDIKRLSDARGSSAIQYAAIDAAVTATHILDWVLDELAPEAYLRLTGLKKGKKPKRGQLGPTSGFVALNMAKDKLPALRYCREIANAVKHRKPELEGPMEDMTIGHTVKLSWEDKKITSATAFAFIQLVPGGEKINALDLFDRMAEQWQDFLIKEDLWVEQPPGPDD